MALADSNEKNVAHWNAVFGFCNLHILEIFLQHFGVMVMQKSKLTKKKHKLWYRRFVDFVD